MSTHLINLTPHDVAIYKRGASEPALVIPSSGALRLAIYPQKELNPFMHGFGEQMEVAVPVLTPQMFRGLDDTTVGWRVWKNNPHGAFVVSMATAQFLVENRIECDVGSRQVYCPASDPDHGKRDKNGVLEGVYAIERYV